MTWVLTIISLIGNFLNCRKLRACFYIWIICNLCWMVYDGIKEQYSRMTLDIIQTVFCGYGLNKWKSKDEEREGD